MYDDNGDPIGIYHPWPAYVAPMLLLFGIGYYNTFHPSHFIRNHQVFGEMVPVTCKQFDCTQLTFHKRIDGREEIDSVLLDGEYQELSSSEKTELQDYIGKRLYADVVLMVREETGVGPE